MRNSKAGLFQLFTFFLTVSLLFGARAEQMEWTVLVPQDECLSVRSQASTGSIKLGKVYLGDTFTGSEIHNGWVKVGPPVSMEASVAYIKADYLTDQELTLLSTPKTYRTTSKVQARTKPGGKRIRTLKKGTELTVIGLLPDAVYTKDGMCVARDFVEEVP